MSGPRVRDNLKRGPVVTVSAPTITCGECGVSTPLRGHWLFTRDHSLNAVNEIRGASWHGGTDMTGADLDFDTCGHCGARFTGGVSTTPAQR